MQVRNDNLANSLFAADPLIGAAKTGKIDSAKTTGESKAPSAADAAMARFDQAKAAQTAMLDEIRQKGIYAWAQEQRFEKLKAQIRNEVLSDNPDADPAAMEQEITRRIREAIEQALKEETNAAARRGESPKPMIIDISV